MTLAPELREPDGPGGFGRVADEIAAAFEKRFGATFRYVRQDKAWAHFCEHEDEQGRPTGGGLWRRGLDGHAQEAVLNLFRKRGDEKLLNSRWRDEVLRLAQHRPGLEADAEDFDQEPFLLAVGNGTIDLRTGELRASRPEDMLSLGTSVAYRPGARAERWERFLAEVCAEDEDLVGYVRRLAGYAATGSTREEVLPILSGAGSNGKSKLVGALANALGDLAKEGGASLVKLGGSAETQPALVALDGVRLSWVEEAPKGLDEATLKALTGGTELTVRTLYSLPRRMRPHFKLLLLCNEPPRLNVADRGLRRRVVVVPFRTRFVAKPAEQGERLLDDRMEEKLCGEAEAILAWIIAGAVEWNRERLGTCAAVEAATSSYWEDANPLLPFVEDALVGIEEVSGADLQARYVEWVEAAKGRRLGSKRFAECMTLLGWTREKTRTSNVWRRTVEGVEPTTIQPLSEPQKEVEERIEPPSTPSTGAPGMAAEAEPSREKTDLRAPCSTCGRLHIGIDPQCRACRQAATVRASLAEHEQPLPASRPGLGDPGYPMLLERAFRAGHITEAELRERLALNTFAYRASA